jgi:hypothetical protein
MIKSQLTTIKEEVSPANKPKKVPILKSVNKKSKFSNEKLPMQDKKIKFKEMDEDDCKSVKSSKKELFVLDKRESVQSKQSEQPRSKSKDNMSVFKEVERSNNKKFYMKVSQVNLTREKIVEDLKKPYLTFNRRNTIGENVRMKNFRVIKNNFGTGKSKKLLQPRASGESSIIFSPKKEDENEIDSQENSIRTENCFIRKTSLGIVGTQKCENKISSIQMDEEPENANRYNDMLQIINESGRESQPLDSPAFYNPTHSQKTILKIIKEKSKWDKFFSVYHVVTSVLFIKREIAKFGVIPRKHYKISDSKEDSFMSKNKPNMEAQLNYSTKSENMKNLYFRKTKVKNTKMPRYLISEDNIYLKYWNGLMILALINTIIIMPYRMSFTDNFLNPKSDIFYLDLSLELLFLIDIIRIFFTSYTNKEGIPETSFCKIFFNYLNGWLIIDIISIFPFYLIDNGDNDNLVINNTSFAFLFRLPKLYRLFRLTKFMKLTKALNSKLFLQKIEMILGINESFVKLFTFFITVFIICHIYACLWYYTAKFGNFEPESWVHRYDLLDEEKINLYLKCIYFAFTSFVTVGYGDVCAYSNIELIVIILWLYIAGIYYSFSLSDLGNIFSTNNLKLLETHKKLMIAEEISKNNNFDKVLEDKIKQHIEFISNSDEGSSDFKNILSELPNSVKLQISLNIFDKRILKIEIFQKSNKNFMANVIPLLKYQTFAKNEIIYSCDEIPEMIFFILSGNVSLLTSDKITYTKIEQGSFFGEIEILKKTYRDSTSITNTFLECLIMNKKILYEDVTEDHSDFFNDLVGTMIDRFYLYEKIKHMIDVIIEEGMTIFFNNHRDEMGKFSKMSNKDFFNVGIKHRLENPIGKIPNEFDEANENNLEINFENFEKKKVLTKRKKQVRSRSFRRKSVAGCIVNKLRENLNKITVEKQNSFELLNTYPNTNFNTLNTTKENLDKNKISLFEEMRRLKDDNNKILSLMESLRNKFNNHSKLGDNKKQYAKNNTINHFNSKSLTEEDKILHSEKIHRVNNNFLKMSSTCNFENFNLTDNNFTLNDKFKKERIKRKLTGHILSKSKGMQNIQNIESNFIPKVRNKMFSELNLIRKIENFNNLILNSPIKDLQRKKSNSQLPNNIQLSVNSLKTMKSIKSVMSLKSYKSKKSMDFLKELSELNFNEHE